jgi:hypothetical protein
MIDGVAVAASRRASGVLVLIGSMPCGSKGEGTHVGVSAGRPVAVLVR